MCIYLVNVLLCGCVAVWLCSMDGTALGFPCVMMFLAHADDLSSKFNALVWCNIALGSSMG